MLIQHKRIPCLYEISWVSETAQLAIHLHQDVVDETFARASAWPIVPRLKQSHSFQSFEADPQAGFGFDGLGLKFLCSFRDFLEFRLVVPAIVTLTERTCPRCEGKKEDPVFGHSCNECMGWGKERNTDWKAIRATALSLNLFLSRMTLVGSSRSSKPQLLTVETFYVNDGHLSRAPLGGAISYQLGKWLATVGSKEQLPGVLLAMKAAYEKMFLRQSGLYQFRAAAEKDGRFRMSCPGDCACLGVDGFASRFLEARRGAEFSSHNVDTLAQQLTLVAGLAAMCDQAHNSGTIE